MRWIWLGFGNLSAAPIFKDFSNDLEVKSICFSLPIFMPKTLYLNPVKVTANDTAVDVQQPCSPNSAQWLIELDIHH